MDPKSAKAIFLDAVENYAPDEWPAYLDAKCAGDRDLREGVATLLAAHQQGADLAAQGREAWKGAFPAFEQLAAEQPGTLVGPYKLLEKIGEGGMGVVYRAEQLEPVRHEVAMKIIKPGMDTQDVIARFQVEQQALAMMNHPNIAKVLGAGTTESGRPYFVMELVPGVPITEFADKNRLTTRQRLDLFCSVCEAVQHAHQKGIIHRDIKPSNVIIAVDRHAPTPKIIDFGIAKAVQRETTAAAVTTGYGQIIGTPLYMSPEQAGLNSSDVDTRTDIYSLGAMLYELLTGTTPFDQERFREADYDEIRRSIREEDPPRPSSRVSTLGMAANSISTHHQTDPNRLSRQLRGELDWIVIKALEKDRDRRYASASSLARDIQKYLADEPVEACPPSSMYRFHKFARRNKVVLASSLIVAASLIVGAGVAVWYSIEATRERDRATRESQVAAWERNNTEAARAESEELATLGLEVLDDIYLDVLGDRLARQREVTVEQRQLLRAGLDYYERFVSRTRNRSNSDLVLGNAYRQVGLIYGRLGDRQKEATAYRQVISLYERLAAQSPGAPDIQFRMALVLGGLLENQAALGQNEQAEESGARALQILEQLRNEHPAQPDYGMALAGTHNRLAWALSNVLPPRDIKRHFQTAISLFEQLAANFPDARLEGELPYDGPLDGAAHSRLHLAQAIHDMDATNGLRLAAFRHFQAKVRSDPHSQWHRAQLAEVSLTLRDDNVRLGVELLEQLHSDFPSVPRHKYRLACACERLGRVLQDDDQQLDQTEKLLRRAVQLSTELVRDYPNTPDYQSHLAAALDGLLELPRAVIDLDEARQLIELAIDRQTEAVKVNPNHRKYREYLAEHLGSLAAVLEELGESESVDQAHSRRIQLLNELRDEDPTTYEADLRQGKLAYADWLARHGDNEDAEERYRELVSTCSTDLSDKEPAPETTSLLGAALHGLGNVALARDELDAARQSFQQAIEHQQLALGARPDRSQYKQRLCRHLCRLGTVTSQLGQKEQTRATWTRAIETFQDLKSTSDAAVHEDVAWTLIDGTAIWAPATVITITEDALQRAPFSRTLWTALGVARCRSEQWQEAIDALSEADRLGGGDSCVCFFQAMANWQLGEKPAAGDWYQQAIAQVHANGVHYSDLLKIREEADACIGSAIAIHRRQGRQPPSSYRSNGSGPLPLVAKSEQEHPPLRNGGTEQLEGTDTTTTDFVFRISRFGDTSGSVTVDWATSDGTAKAGRDYVPGAGQLHFASGVLQKRVTVAVYHDFAVERAEDFVVSLVDVAGATVAQRRAIGIIANDDRPEPIDKWDKAIRYDPDSAITHFKRAVAYGLDRARDDEASADLNRAIEIDPGFAQAYFNRSILRQRRGNSNGALEDLDRAIEFGLRRSAVFNNRGVLHAASGDNTAEAALADFNRAIKLGPPRAEVYNNRSVVHVSRGELEQAIADLDEAIRIYPEFTVAYANRAITRARLGQLELALDDAGRVARRSEPSRDEPEIAAVKWITIPDPDNELLRHFRDETSRLMRSAEGAAKEHNGTSVTQEKVAGESTLPNTELTDPASLRQLVCTPEKMTLAILPQTVDLSQQEHHAMLVAQMKKRLQTRRRQLRLEPLEPRNLLAGMISGTVFEDLNGDGVQDPGEPGMVGQTVVMERTDTAEPLLTIPNPTPALDDRFGGVAAIGDNILISATLDDTVGTDAGAVYLYDGITGDLLRTFTDPTPEDGALFSRVTSLGNNVLVGAIYDDSAGPDAGAVFMFDSSTGDLLQTFLNPTPAEGDNFGNGIVALGNNIVVGANKDDASAEDAGAAYLFDADPMSPTYGELLHTFLNPTPGIDDRFGWPVAAMGDNVLIGSNYDDTSGPAAGAAYLFDGTTGELLQTFLSPTSDAHFGFAVTAFGDNVLVGAPQDDTGAFNAGVVHLLDGTTGELMYTFTNPTPEDGEQFGSWVVVMDNNILIAARYDNAAGEDTGAVYVFDGTTRELVHTFLSPTPVVGDEFGSWSTVDVVGDTVVIGARQRLNEGPGIVYVFEGVLTTTTGTNGDYSFPGLDAGTYQIRQLSGEGYTQTTPAGDGTHSVTLADGDDVTGIDFGNVWDPVLLFSDSFENGQWDGVWVEDSQNDWFTSTQRATDGNYSAEVDGYTSDATLTTATPIDLTPYGGAELTFDWYIEKGLDSGEYLALDLFDGSSWIEMTRLSGNVDQENTWHNEMITVDASYLVDDFQFRFRAKASRYNEDANVDNVKLIATSLATPPNTDPTPGNDAATTDEDNDVTIPVLSNDTDADGDSLAVATVTQGTFGTVTINVDNTITYAPNPDANGTDAFTYTVSDGNGGTDTGNVTVTINAVNDAPVADDLSVATKENLPLAITLTASDVEDDPLTYIIVAPPANGTLTGTVPDLTFTPDLGYNGLVTFTFQANDGELDSNLATVTIDVAANHVPQANDQSVNVNEDSSAAITLAGSDADGDPLTFEVVTGPVSGVLTGTAPDLTYTPSANYNGSDSFTFRVNDGTDDSALATVSITVAAVATGPNLAHGVIQDVGSSWITVDLGATYDSMVVIATPNYDNTSYPGVVRIQNAMDSSFAMRIDAAGPNTPDLMDVYYVVVEEGVYDQPGYKLEAVKFTSTVTDENNSWAGESRTYQQTYSAPVVVGQVMTSNDAWSVFWAAGSSRTTPPSSTALTVGKMVGEDSDTTRVDETIGYLVIDASSSGTDEIEGLPYVAGVGADTVRGPTNAPPYIYNYTAMPNAKTAVVSQAGMDGGNGGWALLYGDTPVPATSGTLSLAVDEDQVGDSERYHTTEQVAYFVIDPPTVTDAIKDQPRETSHARSADWLIVITTNIGDHQRAQQVARQTSHNASHQLAADSPWVAASNERVLVTGQAMLTNVAVSRVARDAAFANWVDDEQLFELFDDEVCPLT